jgi:Mn-dependent DtxR family transcriptional regulator
VPPDKSPKRSTAAVEDYLERIQELIETKGYARVVDIAGCLGVSQASVTNMAKRLDSEGFIRHERYRGMILTKEGESVALAIKERHRILTDFLILLGIPISVVTQDVEGLEHHLSASSLKAIEALCQELSSNPALTKRIHLATIG